MIQKNIFYTDFVNLIKKEYLNARNTISEFFKQENFKKYFIFTYFVYIVGFLSILQANVLYRTDYDKASGDTRYLTNWKHTGRFFNDILVYLFSFSDTPVDISPLSQLFSIFFLTIASLILVKIITKKTTYLSCFVSIIIGLSPYYLQIMNYAFDSVYYAFSTLVAVIPFLFFKEKRCFYFLSVVCMLLCYITYQCSISIYMIIATYMLFLDFQNSKNIKKVLTESLIISALFIIVLIVSYLLIRYTFQMNIEAQQSKGLSNQTLLWAYEQNESRSSLCQLNECFSFFVKRFTKFLNYFGSWHKTPLGYIMEGIIISFFIYQFKKFKNKKEKILNIFLSGLTLSFMFLFIGLWTFFFKLMFWEPRLWVGFGVFFAILMIEIQNETSNSLKRIFSFLSVALIWGCIIFSTHVGNLLKVEHEYEKFKIFSISQDLLKFQNEKIMFKYKYIYSPVVIAMSKKYPVMQYIVSGTKVGSSRWYSHFRSFYRPDLKTCANKEQKFNKVLLNNSLHKFTRINDDCIEIYVK